MAIIIQLPGLEKQIKNLNKMDMQRIGVRALELNDNQIAKKRDHKGKAFRPYSTTYAKRKGVSKSAVDLTSKAKTQPKKGGKPFGTMIQSFGINRSSSKSVEIGFSGTWEKQKARFNVSGGARTDKARPFVGLMTKNRKKLFSFVFKLLSKGTF